MKIGLLTFHWANNYGAVLQAYGLAHALGKLGHSVKFIDYAPPGQRLAWWQGWGFRSGKGMPARTLWRMRFEWFRRRYLPTTGLCRSKEDMEVAARSLDAIIVGSDQVWNGHIADRFESAYFLDFVHDEACRRISYAACFGDPNQPQGTLAKAGALLNRFHALSVRNKMSADLVETLSGIRPEVVLDPTLLYDYAEFLRPRHGGKGYIAIYYLAHPHLSLGLEVLKILKNLLRLPVVLIGADAQSSWAERRTLSAGPVQWMQILNGASFICTDSFHSAIFAVKFKKPFIVWAGYRPDRIQDFLGSCRLEERLIKRPDEAAIGRLVASSIDYDAVTLTLEPMISRSMTFLNQSLSG
jgi:hypothetical protein